MDDSLRQQYETQSKDLRVKIKTWEAFFQKEHNGNKPSKDDIKSNPKIGRYHSTLLQVKSNNNTPLDLASKDTDRRFVPAATYKEYQKVRNILDGKIPPPRQGEDKENRRKRKSPDPPMSFTLSTKRYKQAETPSSRNNQHAQILGQYTPGGAMTAVTPSLSRKLFSPVVPTSIGPTPQRDGRVLGIFDHLPFKDAEIDSPCKPNASIKLPETINDEAKGREVAVQETPRKSKTTDAIALGRTPSSKRRRQQQQQSPRKSLLATPLKPHDGNRIAKTPSTSSSVSRLQFATPAFLRRIPMAKITESSEYVSPEPIRLPRKPLLRGLSSVVADLRKLQEEQMDDDLDALREIENEAGGGGGGSNNNKQQAPRKEADPFALTTVAGPQQKTAKEQEEEAAILAADHLALLGGFEDESRFDNPDGDEENAGRDRDGRPLKVYKKKGQKRTTRKSNMRPVRAKRPSTTTTIATTASDEGDSANEKSHDVQEEDAAAKKTQQGGQEDEDPALLSGSDFAASEVDSDEDILAQDVPTSTSRKLIRKPASAATSKKTDSATVQEKANKPEGKIKKAARKVNELAHANFRRLKLRNNGVKGGPGYNSRFRRRR